MKFVFNFDCISAFRGKESVTELEAGDALQMMQDFIREQKQQLDAHLQQTKDQEHKLQKELDTLRSVECVFTLV